jgi:hypothetical protein
VECQTQNSAALPLERGWWTVLGLGKSGTLLRFAKQLKNNELALQVLVEIQCLDGNKPNQCMKGWFCARSGLIF